MLLLAVIVYVADHGLKLCLAFVRISALPVLEDHFPLSPEVDGIYGVVLHVVFAGRHLGPAVGRLEQLEYLVVPHLEICPARFDDLSCQRRLYDLLAVFLGLDLETEPELRVAPYLIIHYA